MKILIMNAECSTDIDYIHRHFFEQAIGRVVECKWAGHGHPLHVSGEDLNDTIRRVMPDADWVIVSDVANIRFRGAVKIPEKRICKVAFITGDVYWNPPLIVRRLNAGMWDAFLMGQLKLSTYIPSSTEREPVKADPDFYLKNLNAPIFHMAHNINPEFFNLNLDRKIDVSFIGAKNAIYYPLRYYIWKGLPKVAAYNKWKILMKTTPPGESFLRDIETLIKRGHIVGWKYAEALARTKTFIFSSGPGGCPVKKYYEGMASGTCVFADSPMMMEELHFKPGYNFVEIDKDDWMVKLKTYLTYDEERKKIARNGYKTVMKYHTNSVRARQLVDFLEANL